MEEDAGTTLGGRLLGRWKAIGRPWWACGWGELCVFLLHNGLFLKAMAVAQLHACVCGYIGSRERPRLLRLSFHCMRTVKRGIAKNVVMPQP